MEINITKFFNENAASDYSASRMELGDNAGAITWAHAMEDALPEDSTPLLDTEEQLEAIRQWALSSGAWDEDEVGKWNKQELNALFIQLISETIREFNDLANNDWNEWASLAEEGTVDGCLFGGVLSVSGDVYYSL